MTFRELVAGIPLECNPIFFLFHKLHLKDTNACDDGNHDANDENNEAVEVIWGPPSPTIDFVQPPVTPLTLLLCPQLTEIWTLGSAPLFTTLVPSCSAVVDRRSRESRSTVADVAIVHLPPNIVHPPPAKHHVIDTLTPRFTFNKVVSGCGYAPTCCVSLSYEFWIFGRRKSDFVKNFRFSENFQFL